jgi:hypothetical protein
MSRQSKFDDAPVAERPRSSRIHGRQQENQLYFARAYNSPARSDGGQHNVQGGQNEMDRPSLTGLPRTLCAQKPVNR